MISNIDRRELSSYPITKFVRVENADVDSELFFDSQLGEVKYIDTRLSNGTLVRREFFTYGTFGVSNVFNSQYEGFKGVISGTSIPSYAEENAFYYVNTDKQIGGINYVEFEKIGCKNGVWAKCIVNSKGEVLHI